MSLFSTKQEKLLTIQGRAFTFNKKLWSIFLMKASLSAQLLLIAGIAIQSPAIYAQTENNNTAANSSTTPTVQAAAQEAGAEQLDNAEQVIENSMLDEQLSAQGTIEQLEQENAELDAMLEQVSNEEETTVAEVEDVIDDTSPSALEMADSTTEETEMAAETAVEEVVETVDDVMEPALAPDPVVEETNTAFTEQNSELADEFTPSSAPYNFNRAPLADGDIFIPMLPDAKVFAEFVDKLPAVVNYFTMAAESEIINFYTEVYGESIAQERKRDRLTVSYYVDGVATRVIISEQDNYRQVDVLQERTF